MSAKPQTAKPEHEGSGVWWKILIALAILLALGVLGYSIWVGMTNKPTTSVTPPINTPIPPLGNGDNGTTASTSTATATSTMPGVNNYGFAAEDIYPFGQPVSLFANDNDLFRDTNRALGVKVIEFTDSRCQPGVQCVWAGEQGVRLQVTDELTGQTQEVYLGMVRAKTATAFGSTFTLNEIDDGKGGTYASVTVK